MSVFKRMAVLSVLVAVVFVTAEYWPEWLALTWADLAARVLGSDALLAVTHPSVVSFLALPALATLGIAAGLAALLSSVRRRFGGKRTSSQGGTGVPALAMDALDREFLPAALELFETPPSPIRIAAIWFICLAFATTLAWAYFGWLEIYAVAQGRIQPSGRSKVVQPLEPGKVVAIPVENGSKVQAGDLLLELDSKETNADREQQARDLASAQAEAARRRVAVTAAKDGLLVPPAVVYPDSVNADTRAREDSVLAGDLAQLASSRASLLAQKAERIATRERLTASIAARDKLISLDKEHADMRVILNRTQTSSRAQVIEVLQQYETQITTQVGDKGLLAETEAGLLTLDRKLEETTTQFIADQMQKLAEADRKADHLKGELIKATTKHERTRLTAPISGTVQQLAVTTVGQVVTSGQSLITVVPFDAPIEIEAMIQNQDIGFVEAGQPAVVKVESFPYTRFGTIDGTVTRVSRDAVDEREANALSDPKSTSKPQSAGAVSDTTKGQNLVFPATVHLNRNLIYVEGKAIPLSPGMAVTVEIKTGQRRAIDYLLSPLREVTSSSGHER